MHGTRNVLLQIVFMMKMLRSLSLHRTEESSSPQIEKHIHIVWKGVQEAFVTNLCASSWEGICSYFCKA